MPNLLILTQDSKKYLDLIQQAHLPNLEVFTEFNSECDIVFGDTGRIREAIPNLPNLKWVQTTSAGIERLMDPSQRRDYILTNARDVFGESMSEYVFGYILLYKKRIFERYKAQQSRLWDNEDGGRLRSKTIGLLGVGSIGSHLAMTAKHFGMNVWGFTKSSESSKNLDRYFHPHSGPLQQEQGILAFANGLDYLVSVLPRTEDTNKIIDAELLNALPSHAIVINVGRGNAMDEFALVEALHQKKIAGAVLDVTEQEPLPKDHIFWTTPNLLLTFHTSAISYPEDIARLFIENYQLYVEGKPLKHQVDFEKGY
jgi:phosphoglycerate dehydrogenase-like enzyme